MHALQWQRGMMAMDGLQALVRRAVRPTALMGAMFLLMRAELLMRIAPLAAALLAAGLAAG